eukprot:12556773-Prorocentrum_lima.AAC.1
MMRSRDVARQRTIAASSDHAEIASNPAFGHFAHAMRTLTLLHGLPARTTRGGACPATDVL